MLRISQRSLIKSNIRQLTTAVQRNATRNVKMSLMTAVRVQQPWKLTSLYCAKRFYVGKVFFMYLVLNCLINIF